MVSLLFGSIVGMENLVGVAGATITACSASSVEDTKPCAGGPLPGARSAFLVICSCKQLRDEQHLIFFALL